MNRENILKVADAIEQHSIPDLGFNMADFLGTYEDRTGHGCGTTACIAGWGHAIIHGTYDAEFTYVDPDEIAGWLGISHVPACNLFYADNHPLNARDSSGRSWFDEITPKTAVSVLRHLAETGEVDWGRALATEAA